MAEQDGLQVIADAIQLLEQATDRCLTLLATGRLTPAESFGLSDLGLGAALCASHARGLLARDFQHTDVQALAVQAAAVQAAVGQAAGVHATAGRADRPGPQQDAPLDLLRSAEDLIRAPIDTLPRGSSLLIVALCDLIREHRS